MKGKNTFFLFQRAFCVLTKQPDAYSKIQLHTLPTLQFLPGAVLKKTNTYWICLTADDKSNRSLYFKLAGSHALANPHTSAVYEHLNCGPICACQRLGNMKLCGFGVLFL